MFLLLDFYLELVLTVLVRDLYMFLSINQGGMREKASDRGPAC